MTNWRKFQRWLARSWAGFLVPFFYTQEDFHHGMQVLCVWRWGRPTWEIYSWGPNMGSEDLRRHFAPLPFGSREYYHRLQLSLESGMARLVGRYDTWREARDAR